MALTRRHAPWPWPRSTKYCCDCGHDQPRALFNSSATAIDGLYTYCIPCRSRRARLAYQPVDWTLEKQRRSRAATVSWEQRRARQAQLDAKRTAARRAVEERSAQRQLDGWEDWVDVKDEDDFQGV